MKIETFTDLKAAMELRGLAHVQLAKAVKAASRVSLTAPHATEKATEMLRVAQQQGVGRALERHQLGDPGGAEYEALVMALQVYLDADRELVRWLSDRTGLPFRTAPLQTV